jgi:hypothetical protein
MSALEGKRNKWPDKSLRRMPEVAPQNRHSDVTRERDQQGYEDGKRRTVNCGGKLWLDKCRATVSGG